MSALATPYHTTLAGLERWVLELVVAFLPWRDYLVMRVIYPRTPAPQFKSLESVSFKNLDMVLSFVDGAGVNKLEVVNSLPLRYPMIKEDYKTPPRIDLLFPNLTHVTISNAIKFDDIYLPPTLLYLYLAEGGHDYLNVDILKKQCPALRTLCAINYNFQPGVSSLDSMSLLERVVMRGCSNLSRVLHALPSSLRRMDLSGCKFYGNIDVIVMPPNLYELVLAGCINPPLIDLSQVEGMGHLDISRCDAVQFTTPLPATLERLKMDGCSSVLGRVRLSLPSMGKLRCLDLSNCIVSCGPIVESLPTGIEELRLMGCFLDRSMCEAFRRLTGLRHLSLRGCRGKVDFYEIGVEYLPDLRVLDVAGTRYTQGGIRNIIAGVHNLCCVIMQ